MSSRTKRALIPVLCSIVVNLCLAFIKLFVGLRTNSLCIMLDSVNGFFDTVTGVVTAIAFGLTAVKPGGKHPYGLGRSEYAAGFIVSVAATVMGGIFLMDSLSRLTMPEPVWFSWTSFVLILAGVPVKLAMALVFLHFAKKLSSRALKAIAMDCFLDVGITSATVISFTVSARVSYAVDAIFGIVISVASIVVSVKMIVDSVRAMVGGDNAFTEEKAALVAACRQDPLILTIETMRLHDYGYHATRGTVILGFAEGVTPEQMEASAQAVADRVRKETGADLLIFGKARR